MASENQNTNVGREILRTLDKAKIQGYHFKTILIAGMGFFTDAYNLFSISTVARLLGRLYYYDPGLKSVGKLPPNVSAAVNAVALCGTLAGQLFFGWAGDKFGRQKAYGISLLLMIFTSIGSGLSFGASATGVMTTLCFFRFWLGFGIGGGYPLSATIMSEYSNKTTRGAFVGAVFAMQGFGILAACTVSIILSSVFDAAFHRPAFNVSPIRSTPPQADYVWRILFMVGAIPAAATYYYRNRLPETARYTILIAKNTKKAATDMEKVLGVHFETCHESEAAENSADSTEYGLFSREFARCHGSKLVGCAVAWFMLGVAFYSQNLFQSGVFSLVGWIPSARKMSALEEVFRIGRAQALIALVSTIPGYWVTVLLVDIIGRRLIQLQGFFFMTLCMLILTINHDEFMGQPCRTDSSKFCGGNHVAFIAVYALTFFFANFGPNATTFIIPAELFPARLRSTCHGISAASGRLGAIVGAFGFLYASQSQHEGRQSRGYPTGIGLRKSLFLLCTANCIGFIFTFFFVPETKGKSLEELGGEFEAKGENEDLRLMYCRGGEEKVLNIRL
ncbi:hypothetical protein R1sor_012159 [Riccia sorocarpa]|uniref:Major facilitator superfamily (MFS) profile domain-containing protein n=1 Tax=Riccia sorocarpa TaxID=122646 RepID=A0ABD3I2Z7_9MARC